MHQCLYLGLDSIKFLCLVPQKHSQVNPQPEILLSLALKNNWYTNEPATCLMKAWSLKKIIWIETHVEPEMTKKITPKNQTHSWKTMSCKQRNSLRRVYSALSIIKSTLNIGWGNWIPPEVNASKRRKKTLSQVWTSEVQLLSCLCYCEENNAICVQTTEGKK